MNKLEFLKLIANAPKTLKGYSELLDYARNAYKQIMGVFPEGIDNISIKQAAKEASENRKKVIEFPKERITDPFKSRPEKKSLDLAKELEELTNKNLADRGLGSIRLGDDLPPPKKTKPAVDPELQKAEDMKKEFQDFSVRNLTPIEAMKEASSLIGRKGKYKNISESDAKKLLDELDEKIKSDMGPIQSEGDDIFAGGGRVGFKNAGLAGDPMEGDKYVMGQQIPGSSQIPMGQFGPVNVGIYGGGGFSKNEIVPGVDRATINQNYGIMGQVPIGNTGFTLGADYMKSRANERFTGDRIPGQVFKSVPTDSDRFNIGINFKKTFKKGGPVSPGRRTFMKTMAGLASLPFVGKLFKPAAKVAEAGPAIAEGVKLGFDKFMMLVDKIKRLGRPADNLATQERQKVIRYEGKDGSEYELVEDLSTGDISVTKDKPGIAVYGRGTDDVEGIDVIDDRSTFYLKRGRADETTKGKTPPDEYDEVKLEAYDGETFDAVDDVTDKTVKEILEELDVPRTKKAGGGLAYMLGE